MNPRVLVIGPGGVKGFLILGCLLPLEEMLHKVDTYCGVSIGSPIALLLICGYTIKEIITIANKIDFFKNLFYFNLQSTVNHQGLISNHLIRKKLTKLVLKKLGSIPTLYELYMKTGKSLITVTLNMTDERTEYWGPSTHGSESVIDAVIYSMNIPFIYYQLIHHDKLYVDGALGNPYPIDYFDDGQTEILGLYIKTVYEESTITNYVYKSFDAAIEQRRVSIIQNASSRCRHIELLTTFNNVLTTTIKHKAEMLIAGQQAGLDFLNRLPTVSTAPKYIYPEYYLNDSK